MAFYIKRNDTLPTLVATLRVKKTKVAVDLTAVSTIKFAMRKRGALTNKVLGTCTVVGPPIDGQVRYDWVAGDTDTADVFIGEFEIVWLNGRKLTVPNDDDYVEIVVRGDLA